MRGHHTEDCNHLQIEIETLIQRGHLLSYVKETEGSERKRSPSKRESYLDNISTKKGRNTEEVCETPMVGHTLNTISRDFAGGGETSSAIKRYIRSVMHVSQNHYLKGKESLLSSIF